MAARSPERLPIVKEKGGEDGGQVFKLTLGTTPTVDPVPAMGNLTGNDTTTTLMELNFH